MLLLVTDTSGKNGFVALARAEEGADKVEVIEEVPLSGGTFSAQLVPQISGLLEKHRFEKTEIGAFVVVAGPGSFTGLRVGLAAIKALAEVLGKPIVPLSLLEVVALATHADGKVLAVLDAGRGEVYTGQYEIQAGTAHLVCEQLIRKEELPAIAGHSVVSTPDAGLADLARVAGFSVFRVETVAAHLIATLGWAKLRAGETVTPERLEANYIRRSDAEIFAKSSS